MGLVTGEHAGVEGFVVIEARPGRYEVTRQLDATTAVSFSGSTEARVLEKAASWIGEQSRRKDGGWLKKPAPKPKAEKKANDSEEEVVEA